MMISVQRYIAFAECILSILLLNIDVIVHVHAEGKLVGDLRIVGGTPAAENPSFGFSAGSKLCAGTLIYPEYVDSC